MAERYTKLFSLASPLYAEGSPVVIEAGALLLDNVGGSVLAQLKFKSVSPKTVKALTVSVTAKDTVGRVIGVPTVHQYLDLDVQRDAEFGQKSAIALPSENTRKCEVRVLEAAFADNSVWTAPDGLRWEPLPVQTPLFPNDAELLRQYRMDINHAAKFELRREKDLWLCSCGAVNRAGEKVCHSCEAALSEMENADLPMLEKRRAARLEEEEKAAEAKRIAAEKAAEAKRIAAEKAAKKTKKILSIAIPAVIAVIAIVLVATKVIIPNSNYNAAVDLMDNGKYEEAIAAFEAMDGYKDSSEKAKSIYAQYCKEQLSAAEVGDTVYFGTYEQDNDTSNGKEKIEWQVLAKENNRVLVISKYALDCQPYNAAYGDVTWESCTLRTWLNGTFLNSAFSEKEQAAIAQTTVTADKNPEYDTDPGNATTDKVFLLGIDEADKYFSSDSARQCEPTAFAVANGAKESDSGNCWWWLRSPGYLQHLAASVSSECYLYYEGHNVNVGNSAIRPAMWINLAA